MLDQRAWRHFYVVAIAQNRAPAARAGIAAARAVSPDVDGFMGHKLLEMELIGIGSELKIWHCARGETNLLIVIGSDQNPANGAAAIGGYAAHIPKNLCDCGGAGHISL